MNKCHKRKESFGEDPASQALPSYLAVCQRGLQPITQKRCQENPLIGGLGDKEYQKIYTPEYEVVLMFRPPSICIVCDATYACWQKRRPNIIHTNPDLDAYWAKPRFMRP